jgi:signal transduction histidine kinase/ActR/RegA family two-component response regulator
VSATPPAKPARRAGGFLSRHFSLLTLGATALLLASGVTVSLSMDRAAAERQAMREIGVLADTMAAQAGSLLGVMHQALMGLRETAASDAPPAAMAAALARREGALPPGSVLALLAPDGAPNLPSDADRLQVAGLDHAALAGMLAALPEAMPEGRPALGPVVQGAEGVLLPLMRRLSDGRIGLALLPLQRLEDFYAGLDLTPGSMVALLDQDLRLLVRMPPSPPDRIGQPMHHIRSTAAGTSPPGGWNGEVVSAIDQQTRYTAMRPVPGYPLLVAVGFRNGAALSHWARRAWLGGSLTVLALVSAGLGLVLVEREARRRLQAQASFTARLERLARGSASIAAIAELPALLEHIGRLAREALAVPYACITLHEGDRQEQTGAQRAVSIASGPGFPPAMLSGLERWAAHGGRAAEATPRLWPAEQDGLPARASIGLRDEQGQPLGALAVAGPAGGDFSVDDEAMLAQLARLAEIAIRNRGLIAAAQRAAEEASSARQRVERLLESVSDGFVALDAGWCVTYANATALAVLERTRAEVIGRSVWEICPALVGLEAFEQLQAVASRGLPRDFEQHFETPPRWFQAHAFAAADGVAVFFREVTETRRTEQRMQQSQRMETVGRLTGSVAHDFNNLLAVIVGNAEMLEDELEHDPVNRHSAWLIRDAADRGAGLVKHLLAFAGHQPQLAPQDVAPESLMAGLMPLLHRAVGQKVRVELRQAPPLPRLKLLAGQAENALLNLAVNARDAMEDGGSLTFTLDAVELDQADLEGFPESRPGRFLRLVVSDTGHGMTPEVLQRAVEPFFSTKQAGTGAGLGLASVYAFARQNGGLLRLDSAPGQGTRVTLMLPEATASADSGRAAALPRGSESLLLVEDEAAQRNTMLRQLSGLGYRVTAVPDAAEALALLDQGLSPDLLLADVILRGSISGPRLAVEMRERLPDLRILLVSGYALVDAVDGEGPPLLAKPVDASELALLLRRLLDAPPAPLGLQSSENYTQGLV